MQELVLKIESKILSSNIDSFAESVKTEIAKINTELKSDDDFAAAEAQVKELKKAEDALKAAKDEALAEAQDVRKLLEQTEEIAALLAKTRLNLDKQIKAEKERRKAEITDACRNTLSEMIKKADVTIAPALTSVIKMQQIDDAIAEAIKGKKSLVSIDTATAQVLQTWSKKIQDSEAFLLKRLAKLPQDKLHLFPDVQQLLTLGTGFSEAVAERIKADAERQAAEQARLEAQAKAKEEAEARAKIEAERQAAEQAEAAAAQQTDAAPAETAAPAATSESGAAECYRIILHCSLDEAKAIAKAIKEQHPNAFNALKKGE